jgi:hypothetical protein
MCGSVADLFAPSPIWLAIVFGEAHSPSAFDALQIKDS